jgi:DivIVA domain-containing protein
VRDVDAFADRVAAHLQLGGELTVADAREVLFARQRGGYEETQVDVVIDAVIDLLQTVD